MCTAIGFCAKDAYFGRNLDLEAGFGEQLVLTPRNYRLRSPKGAFVQTRHALLGMAAVEADFPLYAEAISEKGLAMAGLHFVGNAFYAQEKAAEKINLATFELIPWLLGQAETFDEAQVMLSRVCLLDTPFRDDLPTAELHWFLTDGKRSLVMESTKKGIDVYEDPLGVLTNNPPFPYQMAAWAQLEQVVCRPHETSVLQAFGINATSYGTDGALVAGGYSSSARFQRAAWLLQHMKPTKNEAFDIANCFAVLSAVAPVYGSVSGADGNPHYTRYSVCANLSRGSFYWRGYDSPQIGGTSFDRLPLNARKLIIKNAAELRPSMGI